VSKPGEQGPRIVAVGGAKGGTGKSLVAANLGIFLSTLGKQVTLIDAAFGSPNLHQFVGVPRPSRTLSDMLGNNSVPLDHVVVETGISGLGLVAGEGDPAWAANPKSAQINKLIARIRQLEGDYVVIDLGAGCSGVTLDLFLLADVGIVVAVPEPTSVELAYRFLRAGFVRRLRKVGVGAATDIPAEELRLFEGGIPAPSDIYERVRELDDGVAERVLTEMGHYRPRFVVNNVRSKADMALCKDMARAVQRRMGVPAEAFGHIEYDDTVAVAVRRRRPLLVEHPESRVGRCIERLTRKLLSHDTTELPALGATGDSYYDLLEIEPSATDEEIRRANRRIREIYARDSLVVGALYNKARLDDIHLRIDEAYETLMDPVSRKAYDQALFPGGIPTVRSREESERTPGDGGESGRASAKLPAAPAVPRPPRPELPPDTEFTGRLMREVRESMGIDLRDISNRTKIGMGYLTAIEEETFAKLPAVVYVRGFLVQYARVLQLDERRVLGTYLERYKNARIDPTADDD